PRFLLGLPLPKVQCEHSTKRVVRFRVRVNPRAPSLSLRLSGAEVQVGAYLLKTRAPLSGYPAWTLIDSPRVHALALRRKSPSKYFSVSGRKSSTALETLLTEFKTVTGFRLSSVSRNCCRPTKSSS